MAAAPKTPLNVIHGLDQRNPDTWYFHLAAVTQQSARDALGRATVNKDVMYLAVDIGDVADAVMSWFARLSLQQLACREGCAWCCSFAVEATAQEVLAIVHHLHDTLSAEEYAAAGQRAREAHARTDGLAWHRRIGHRFACPLLVENRCSAYSVRPLQCRGCHSVDAAACEAAANTGDFAPLAEFMDGRRKTVTDGMMRGLATGIAEANFDGNPLDMNAALVIAFNDLDGVTARWLAGESVFASAHIAKDTETTPVVH